MIRTVTHTIGRDREFPTLAAWAASLPPDLRAAGESRVALLTPGAEDPGGAVIGAVCDAKHHMLICTERGASTDGRNAPRATVRAKTGPALSLIGRPSHVALSWLDIVGEAGAPVRHETDASTLEITGCVLEAECAEPALRLVGVGSSIRDSVVIQRGAGEALASAAHVSAQECTVARCGPGGAEIAVARTARPPTDAVEVDVANDVTAGGSLPPRPLRGRPRMPVDLVGRCRLGGPGWRAVGATVDPRDTVRGPLGMPLQRLGNLRNAFARFDGPAFASLGPGAAGAVSVVVAAPTTLSSALTLTGRIGRAELRVHWTETPPGFVLLDRAEELAVAGGGVTEVCRGTYCLTLEARNLSDAQVEISPSLHVACGIENAGLDVGMYSGAFRAGCPGPRAPSVWPIGCSDRNSRTRSE